jgi:diadenosine tetraphosphate (Ap4A) HIT family hydrolase
VWPDGGRPANDLIARLLPGEPYVRRVLLESRGFATVPSLGPLAPGHVLLCPKVHVGSFARLPESDDAECEEAKRRLRALLREAYGCEVHLFEHGTALGGRPPCTVDHAHLHFVPLPPTFAVRVGDREDWQAFDGSPAGLRRLTQGLEYILYEAPDGAARVRVGGAVSFESQSMRKAIAIGLGSAALWNWRDRPDARSADETWRRLAALGGVGA